MPRVMIIGLDGATFDIIDPLVNAGRLPTMAWLLENGVRGRLSSTIPPATIPAWPTFMTGKTPGNHGVFDFFSRDDQGERRLSSSRDIRGPTLWRYLSSLGHRCIVLNVPCTYPPEPINGVLVTGMLTPAGAAYTHPSETATQLDDWTGGYLINPRAQYVRSPFDPSELIQELRHVSNIQKQAFLNLLAVNDWDFAMIMFRATDIIQHKLWHQARAVEGMYEFIDNIVEDIIAASKDASLWLMSDHGFGPQGKVFHINRWLRDQGWLSVHRNKTMAKKEPPLRAGQEAVNPATRSQRLLLHLGLSRDRVRTLLPQSTYSFLRRNLPHRLRRRIPQSSYGIDWTNTLVFNDNQFTQETQALRINLRGRESDGVVDPDGYEGLREAVIHALSDIRDPDTGQAVVTRVHKGEQLFAGAYTANAPDLVLQLKNGYKMIGDFGAREIVSGLNPIAGCHRPDGVFIAAGEGIASDIEIADPTIVDMMPTILHYIGLAVPSDCDGEVLRDVFDSGSEPALRRVHYREVSAAPDTETEHQNLDEQVVARLRDLGYIE
jgi:predicted AlkP superfamily phosphohydrolase/phosphomutase